MTPHYNFGGSKKISPHKPASLLFFYFTVQLDYTINPIE